MTGFWTRVSFAFRSFFAILLRGEIPPDVAQVLLPATQERPAAAVASPPAAASVSQQPKASAESLDRALQVLGLLQRDGRLIDFLSEDVSPYPDSQLGAAVRSIHTGCRQVLQQYLKLEPVLDSEEDQPVTVPAGFDPAMIKLIGNVSGQPPLRGLLRHRGWRLKEANLPSLAQASGRAIIAPAEVEIP